MYVLRLHNPPVNALSLKRGTVGALSARLDAALADGGCHALVIAGSGRMFCAGADINDFDGDPAALGRVRDLMNAIEQAQKPVIIAMHGAALGGGLELAMCGHYRIAAKGTKLGLPEVTLGILPGSGGTQRLPRLVDVAQALSMMLGGQPLSAEEALPIGLVDMVVAGDPVEAALAFAAQAGPLACRPTRERPLRGDVLAALAQARTSAGDSGTARARAAIMDCVLAASEGDFDRGLRAEREACAELIRSKESRQLRQAFFGRGPRQ
ncbi:MAG: enoyl-CoA hydratase-related protein [Novosphingobium sp.]